MRTKLCPHCKTVKSICNFSFKDKTKTTFSSWCKTCRNIYTSTWYSKNLHKIKKQRKQFYSSNKSRLLATNKERREACLKSWEGFIPTTTQCQVCGKTIFFNRKDRNNSIHFDHRSGGTEKIKGSPNKWLSIHLSNKDSQAIWKECNFGFLCSDCNRCLPTKDRVKFYINIGKYITAIHRKTDGT